MVYQEDTVLAIAEEYTAKSPNPVGPMTRKCGFFCSCSLLFTISYEYCAFFSI